MKFNKRINQALNLNIYLCIRQWEVYPSIFKKFAICIFDFFETGLQLSKTWWFNINFLFLFSLIK